MSCCNNFEKESKLLFYRFKFFKWGLNMVIIILLYKYIKVFIYLNVGESLENILLEYSEEKCIKYKGNCNSLCFGIRCCFPTKGKSEKGSVLFPPWHFSLGVSYLTLPPPPPAHVLRAIVVGNMESASMLGQLSDLHLPHIPRVVVRGNREMRLETLANPSCPGSFPEYSRVWNSNPVVFLVIHFQWRNWRRYK